MQTKLTPLSSQEKTIEHAYVEIYDFMFERCLNLNQINKAFYFGHQALYHKVKWNKGVVKRAIQILRSVVGLMGQNQPTREFVELWHYISNTDGDIKREIKEDRELFQLYEEMMVEYRKAVGVTT